MFSPDGSLYFCIRSSPLRGHEVKITSVQNQNIWSPAIDDLLHGTILQLCTRMFGANMKNLTCTKLTGFITIIIIIIVDNQKRVVKNTVFLLLPVSSWTDKTLNIQLTNALVFCLHSSPLWAAGSALWIFPVLLLSCLLLCFDIVSVWLSFLLLTLLSLSFNLQIKPNQVTPPKKKKKKNNNTVLTKFTWKFLRFKSIFSAVTSIEITPLEKSCET